MGKRKPTIVFFFLENPVLFFIFAFTHYFEKNDGENVHFLVLWINISLCQLVHTVSIGNNKFARD